jgi:hypothetical protein
MNAPVPSCPAWRRPWSDCATQDMNAGGLTKSDSKI